MEKSIVLFTAIICLSLLILQIIILFRHSKMVKVTAVDVACAGSSTPGALKNVIVQNLSTRNFQTEVPNESINFDSYKKFWVKGNSMLLCGIENGDILFTRPIKPKKIKDLNGLPKALVLKREGRSLTEAIAKDDYARYKIRRTWAILPFDEDLLLAKVDEILHNTTFQDLRAAYPENFLSNEEMKTDCREKRIGNYLRDYPNCKKDSSKDNLVIISTTLREENGKTKVFFSIHPARIIVGEAVYTFHKKEETQEDTRVS